jgi:N-acetylglucosaminyl-diphospho-decaprenol L-rhamnosyltransferase
VPAADALAVVVVSHNSADHLPALLEAVLPQLSADDELLVVDNLSADGSPDVACGAGARARVIETGANLGFAGGCHVGADATSAPLLLFLNPDSYPVPGCLDHLRAAAGRHAAWGAWQAAVLQPDKTINTDGGVVHFLGMGWAGDCGKPVSALPPEAAEAAFPSGAAMVVRRTTWDRLGGLDASYFLYGEDLDLGLRIWLSGERIGVVPDAHVVHSYEFEKGTGKWFWLERNRLRTVLSVYPLPLLALLAPALLAAEVALVAIAASNGWLGAKLRAEVAVIAGLPSTLRRRRAIQAEARLTAGEFAARLTASLDSDFLPLDAGGPAARLQAAYWRFVRAALGTPRDR